MDLNQSDDERNNFFEVDDETDMWFMMQAYEYNQRLQEEQNPPRLMCNPINREREDAEIRLMADYFDDYFKYPLYYFRRRYRMNRKLFLDIVKSIESSEVDHLPKHFHFFTHRPDATGQMSMSIIMKCTSTIRQLAYDNAPDAFDEYLQMGEQTAHQKMAFNDWNEMYANLSGNMQRTWIKICDVQRRKAKEIRDKEVHLRLQQNLIEHIWQQREDDDE
ncbi:hypothetical protein Tco_0175093 [Tanacetum coccineum]